MRKPALPFLLVLLLLAGCSGGPHQEEELFTLAEEQAVTFSDGVSADRWQDEWGNALYKLSDGTELLRESRPIGPENVYTVGRENFDGLSETAQTAISAYYEERGLLYELDTQLERVYQNYLACRKSGQEFRRFFLEQSTTLSASNDRMVYFLTSWSLPTEEPGVSDPFLQGEAFDRETGERTGAWDLFTVPEAEARAWVAEQAAGGDPTLREEMEAALEPEWIVLSPEGLSVYFPRGTLPGQETASGWSVRYEKAPLQPWAIPDAPD